MSKKISAAVLASLLYGQLAFGIAAVGVAVYERSAERHSVVAVEMADANQSPALIR